MIGRLNHVAIAVPDLTEASAQYKQMLGDPWVSLKMSQITA